MAESFTICGKCAVPGIVCGTLRYPAGDVQSLLASYRRETTQREKEQFLAARGAALEAAERISRNLTDAGKPEQASILETRKMILSDSILESQVFAEIESGLSAPEATLKASKALAAQIAGVDDPYLRERSVDVENAGRELSRLLLGEAKPGPSDGSSILCGEEIDPSAAADEEDGAAAGLVIGSGSVTSHVVIIAKSRGIPTIVGVDRIREQLPDGAPAILDGGKGLLIVNPDPETAERYREKAKQEKDRNRYFESLSDLPAVTRDGHRVTLAANIGKPHDIDSAVKYGMEGVGLFRTEFLFMGSNSLPTEQEQFEAYRYVIKRCRGQCVIRTMDIGGDKPLPYLQIPPEKNPFLGWRAIRISLERTDLFLTQIRAILRASHYGKAAVMLPMISGLEEIRKARELITECMGQLRREGIPFDEAIPVGIMVETPAAVWMAPEFAAECDFFSIGTNDLVQYTLAADRGNPKLASLYTPFHPAVLRSILRVIRAAHDRGIPVSMCGEMSGDPRAAGLLCSLGLDEFSMSPPSIPKVKDAIRGLTRQPEAAEKILSCSSTAEIEAVLEAFAEPSMKPPIKE